MTDGPPINTEAELLEAAADYIERYGWIQNLLFSSRGVCIWGGIVGVRHLCRGETSGVLLEALALERLCKATEPFGSLAFWNDTPGRKKQEVLDLLRKSAKEARSEEEDKCAAGRFLLSRTTT